MTKNNKILFFLYLRHSKVSIISSMSIYQSYSMKRGLNVFAKSIALCQPTQGYMGRICLLSLTLPQTSPGFYVYAVQVL